MPWSLIRSFTLRNFEGWIEGAEKKIEQGYPSPNNMEEATTMVNNCKVIMIITLIIMIVIIIFIMIVIIIFIMITIVIIMIIIVINIIITMIKIMIFNHHRQILEGVDGPDYRSWSSPRTWQGEDIVNLCFSLTFVWLEEQVEQNRTESTSVSVWDFCFLDKSTLEDFGKMQEYFPGERGQNDFACRPRCPLHLHESQVEVLEIEKTGFIIVVLRKFMFLSYFVCESGG